MYLVVDHLWGTIEKINDSKDRYLVINNNSLMCKKNIRFFCLLESIINKIKYLKRDDNEVIIKLDLVLIYLYLMMFILIFIL